MTKYCFDIETNGLLETVTTLHCVVLKDIDTKEINVPIHFPNIIPDKISKGEPKPQRTTQIIENMKKRNRLNTKFSPITFSILSCIVL